MSNQEHEFTIIKNGCVVTEDSVAIRDILIKNEKISKIALKINHPDAGIINAENKIVIPGGVDVHTHFCLKAGKFTAEDDFQTGTIAAACGGTTTIVDHPGFGPTGCDLMHQIKHYEKLADNAAVIDYSVHGVLQHITPKILSQIPELIQYGIPSIKAYLVYDFALNNNDVFNAMQATHKAGGILAIHCEDNETVLTNRNKFLKDKKLTPEFHPLSRNQHCEAKAINNMIELSIKAGNTPIYIVHVSAAESVNYITSAHSKGFKHIIAETCPQYLLLNDKFYSEPDALKYILTPPLRKPEDSSALWNAINSNDISAIGTDHCPFNFALREKVAVNNFMNCPNGLPGVENRIPLMFSEGVKRGKISLRKFVEINCTNPAKIMGLYPRKGVLRKNSDADIVIIDPEKEVTIQNKMLHQNVDYTPYENFKLMGYPDKVLSKGKVIVENNKFIGNDGAGRFIKRKPYTQ